MRVFGVFLSLNGLLFILCEREKFYYFLCSRAVFWCYLRKKHALCISRRYNRIYRVNSGFGIYLYDYLSPLIYLLYFVCIAAVTVIYIQIRKQPKLPACIFDAVYKHYIGSLPRFGTYKSHSLGLQSVLP